MKQLTVLVLLGACLFMAAQAQATPIVNNSGTSKFDSLILPFEVYDSLGNPGMQLGTADSVYVQIRSAGGLFVRDSLQSDNARIINSTYSSADANKHAGDAGTQNPTSYFVRCAVSALAGAGADGIYFYRVVAWDRTNSDLRSISTGSFSLYTPRDLNAMMDFVDAAITSRLAPTVAARTLDVAATGEAGIDLDNTVGTLQDADIDQIDVNPGTGTIVSADFASGAINDAVIASDAEAAIGLAAWNTSFVTAFTGGSMGDSVNNYRINTILGNVNGSVGSVTGAVGSVTGAVGSVTGAVGSVTGAVGSVTTPVALAGTQTFNNTGTWTGNVTGSVGSVTGAVGSVAGAVGSVTGNVGGNVVGTVGTVNALASGAITATALDGGAAREIADTMFTRDSASFNNGPATSFGTLFATPAYVQGTAGSLTATKCADTVWNRLFASVYAAGPAGSFADSAKGWGQTSASSLTPRMIADTVWRSILATYSSTPGSFGDSARFWGPAGNPAGSADWSTGERNQIRKALGVDGTHAEPTTGDTTGVLGYLRTDGGASNVGAEVTNINGWNSASGVVQANMAQVSTDAIAADNLETMLDGTGGGVLSLGQLRIVASIAQDTAIVAYGADAGPGMHLQGGSTGGTGLQVEGGTGSGDAANFTSISGDGLEVTGGTNGRGLFAQGFGTGSAIFGQAQGSGSGLQMTGAGIGAGGIFTGGVTNGPGLSLAGTAGGAGILSFAGNTGVGLDVRGGATSGTGAKFAAQGGDDYGLALNGFGTGPGLRVQGGARGVGAYIQGGSTDGDGLQISAVLGDGIQVSPAGGGDAVKFIGPGAFTGLRISSALTGPAVTIAGGSVSGEGVKITTTSGSGILVAPTAGDGLNIAAVNGDGIDVSGGTGGVGLKATGQGAGAGASFIGGATGAGLALTGDTGMAVVGLSGSGIDSRSTGGSGHGLYLRGNGTNAGAGLYADSSIILVDNGATGNLKSLVDTAYADIVLERFAIAMSGGLVTGYADSITQKYYPLNFASNKDSVVFIRWAGASPVRMGVWVFGNNGGAGDVADTMTVVPNGGASRP